MVTITITWAAFGGEDSARVLLPESYVSPLGNPKTNDFALCEAIFESTNLQDEDDELWMRISEVLPPGRTHTSVSVGDMIEIDDRPYWCASMGWERHPPLMCSRCRANFAHSVDDDPNSIRSVCQPCYIKYQQSIADRPLLDMP